ncbi:hypothetical protein G9A89_009923 [Geosiphon pyriformis]|nr:hypothetical protein G9A89_009923 [Geosiphon pyriformis]
MELIDSVFPSILKNIRKYLEKKPSNTTQILFTGHAIAPRIGNEQFSRFANILITHHRITHGNDHVPHSPLAKLGWNNFGIEIWT